MNIDLTKLSLIANLLAGVGLTVAQAEQWVKDYEAAHPDTVGLVDAFWAWVKSHVSDANIAAGLAGAVADLSALVQTGKGPIASETPPTDFA